MNDDLIINQIEISLRDYDLNDIKKISELDTVIASFILCTCFIEHICTFRYGVIKKINDKEFCQFIVDYMDSKYEAKKLREDLRNKLVHNYSLGFSYSLIKGYPSLHLKKNNENQQFLNLESFIIDLEDGFNKYINELKANKDNLRKLAVQAYERVRIIRLNNILFQ